MKTSLKAAFAAVAAFLALAPPAAADQVLPQARIVDGSGDILFGALKFGRRQAGKTILTPDAIEVGTGSTGDVSGMSATPNISAAPGTIARLTAERATLLGPNAFLPAAPDWNNYTTPYTPNLAVIGGYPTNALAGGNTVGTTHALTGAVTIPETTRNNTQAVFAAGVAGYARSLNSTSVFQQAVGVYGAGLCGKAFTSCWGRNMIVANLPDLSEPQANRGVTNINMWGDEVDMNIQRLPDGSAPGGNATGIDLVGNSAVQPLGNFRAIWVQPPGLYTTPKVPWKQGFYFDPSSTNTGIVFDTAATTSGDAIVFRPSNATGASGSQSLRFETRKSDNSTPVAYIRTGQNGDFLITPAAGTNTTLSKSDLSTSFSAGDAGVFINVDGTVKPVSVGDASTCGNGYRCLRVPN